MKDLFEIPTPAYKLVRNNDPSTSHEAAEKLDVSKMERIVLQTINKFPNGCISDDVLNALPEYRYNTITPRYIQLKEKGYVIVDGTKRKGNSNKPQQVMWSKENYV
tara:strand:+ start:1492 stop:1809 length:318 start_codon:yes stop_codon:yes gene_type:complete